MNDSILSCRNIDPEALPLASASRLLRMGIAGNRPIDALIARLRQPDGPAWFARVLTVHAGLSESDLRSEFLDPTPSLQNLTRHKDAAKKTLASGSGDDSRLVAITLYFFALAAGLRHHRVLIGSRPREEINEILLDFAAAAPEPWSTFLSEAAVVKT